MFHIYLSDTLIHVWLLFPLPLPASWELCLCLSWSSWKIVDWMNERMRQTRGQAEELTWNRCSINITFLPSCFHCLLFALETWQIAFHVHCSTMLLSYHKSPALAQGLPLLHWIHLMVNHSSLLEIHFLVLVQCPGAPSWPLPLYHLYLCPPLTCVGFSGSIQVPFLLTVYILSSDALSML